MKDHKTAMKPFRLTSMCLCFIAQQVGKQYSVSTREIYSRLNTWGKKKTLTSPIMARVCRQPCCRP